MIRYQFSRGSLDGKCGQSHCYLKNEIFIINTLRIKSYSSRSFSSWENRHLILALRGKPLKSPERKRFRIYACFGFCQKYYDCLSFNRSLGLKLLTLITTALTVPSRKLSGVTESNLKRIVFSYDALDNSQAFIQRLIFLLSFLVNG